MRSVLQAILQAKRPYADRPLFQLMRDEARSPRERLAFFPCMAPFILAFGDLNKYVMRDEASTDPLQVLVNRHTYEDDHHWPWYLEDLAALGFDRPTSMSRMLALLYSSRTRVNRMLNAEARAPVVRRVACRAACDHRGDRGDG
jgi:hypothetical protein